MALTEPRRKAPAFTLKDQHGKSHSLKDYLGRIVVLYFYQRDGTPGCTSEACQFRDHHPDFTKIKGVVLGISPDLSDSHEQFADEHQLPFTLLSDAPVNGTPRVCQQYGVWGEKSMYGRPYMGVIRTTYLIDQQGKVARRWDRVSVPGHAAQVLEAVKLLHSGEPLIDIEGRPVRLPKLKHHKKTRSHDSDPTYQPIRGSGNKSTRGPVLRQKQRPVPEVRGARPPALSSSRKK